MGRPGLVGTMARTAVIAGTASAVVGGAGRRQQAKAGAQQAQLESQAEMAEMQQQVAQLQAQQAAAPPPPPPPAAAAPAGDIVAQLQQLADLHASGLLSDEELSAAKLKLLA